MCHFAMGLTHCYKTTVFLHLYTMTVITIPALSQVMNEVTDLTYEMTPTDHMSSDRL